MTINFGPARLATHQESRLFERMNIFILKDSWKEGNFDYWFDVNTIDFGRGKLGFIDCAVRYVSTSANYFRCSTNKANTQEPIINWKITPNQRIVRIRHSDIDKDGDIDIAIKLTNGAIYVFHNGDYDDASDNGYHYQY